MLCYLLGSWNVGFEGITVLWDLSRCWVRGYTYYWVITWLEKTLIIRDNFWLWMSKLYVFFSLSAFLLTRKYDFVTNQVSGLGTNWFKIQSKTFDCNQVSSQLSFSRLQKFNYNFSGSTATQFLWLQSHHQHERKVVPLTRRYYVVAQGKFDSMLKMLNNFLAITCSIFKYLYHRYLW